MAAAARDRAQRGRALSQHQKQVPDGASVSDAAPLAERRARHHTGSRSHVFSAGQRGRVHAGGAEIAKISRYLEDMA